jgi:hypothetical protein
MKKKLLALMLMGMMLLTTAAPAFALGCSGDEGPPTLGRDYRAS